MPATSAGMTYEESVRMVLQTHNLRSIGNGCRRGARCVIARRARRADSGERPLLEPSADSAIVLERGKGADVADPALLIECGDWLRAQPLAPRRAHDGNRHARVDFGDHDARHLAALIHFDHDPISFQLR